MASDFLPSLTALLDTVEVTDHARGALSLSDATGRGVTLLREARSAGRKAMLIGNGGSAAIVGHMHCDLSNAARMRALVFQDVARLTALANDYGYATALERPVALWAEKDDVLVAVSSSGRSENILQAVRAGSERGCRAITFSGFDADNPLRAMGVLNFWIPSRVYGLVEVAHMALAHMISDGVAAGAPAAS